MFRLNMHSAIAWQDFASNVIHDALAKGIPAENYLVALQLQDMDNVTLTLRFSHQDVMDLWHNSLNKGDTGV